jgi:DnaJ-class molecular chaperone
MPKSYYEMLEITVSANQDEVKKAYRKLGLLSFFVNC